MVFLYPILSFMFIIYAKKHYESWKLTIPILYQLFFMCIFCPIFYFHPQYRYSTHAGEVGITPIIYWFAVFFITIYPLKNIRLSEEKFLIPPIHKLNILSIFLILISVVTSIIYLPFVSNGLDAAQFEINKEIAQSGELVITTDRYLLSVLNLHSTFRSFISFLFMFYLAFIRGNKIIKFGLGFSAIVPIVFMTMAKCVRVDTAFMIIELFVLYYLFQDRFGDKIKKNIKLCGIIIGGGGSLLMVSFSLMRFSSGNWDFDPLFYIYSYLSESILNFNTLMFDNINITTNGDANFPLFKSYLGLDYATDGADFKTMYLHRLKYSTWYFYTFIGDFCRDLNLWGTLVFFIILSFFMKRFFMNNSIIHIGGLFVLFFYIKCIGCGLFYNQYNGYFGNLTLQNLLIFVFISNIWLYKIK